MYTVTKDLVPNPMLLSDPLYAAQQLGVYYENRTGPFTDNRGLALAMLPLRNVTSDYQEIIDRARRTDPTAYLPKDIDSTVLKGYLAVRAFFS